VALSCLCLPRSRGINEFRTISFNSIECRFQAGATLLSVRLFPSPKGTCCNRSCSTGRSGFKIGQIQASNLRSFLTEETKSDPYAANVFYIILEICQGFSKIGVLQCAKIMWSLEQLFTN
jgi:hypothetical protein